MSQPLVYVDRSRVRQGALGELKRAIAEVTDFIEENEPQLVSYDVFFSDDDSEMTVIHVHADAASLDRHFEVAGARFAGFADLLTLSSIEIYGAPSPTALQKVREKAIALGSADVVVHPLHAGFVRPAPP